MHSIHTDMEFEWDESKNLRNIEKHGLSFERARKIFDGFFITWEDTRYDYGEVREVSLGNIEGVVMLAVVHTDRDGRIRIISARRANAKERRLYYEEIRKRTDT